MGFFMPKPLSIKSFDVHSSRRGARLPTHRRRLNWVNLRVRLSSGVDLGFSLLNFKVGLTIMVIRANENCHGLRKIANDSN